jgi:beta-galactosidase
MRLEQRYGTPARMAEAYGLALDSFDIAPPQRFDAKDARGLAWHLDWAEHQEATIADAFAKFRAALSYAGLERVPTCHNLPMGESATPLDPARLGKVVECLGMDYYHVASESSADAIFRRTTEVAARADAFEYPAFAIELAAGFPPFFPPLTEQDNRFAALACLAAGIRGFNLYMAVERDRWIGSPIDRFGKARPSFDFWQRLNEAVRRTRLPELSRMADVCVIVPRSMHRLERMLHAFGPMSAAAFDVMGLGAYDSCLEQGPFASSLFEAESFLRQLLGALNQQGIAYRVAGNDAAATALAQSRFGYVTAASGLEPELWQVLGEVAERGTPLYFGPALPRTAPDAVTALPPLPPAAAPQCEAVSAIGVSASLAAALRAHGAFQLAAGRGLRNSVFRDQGGVPRVLFILNTTNTPQIAKLDAPFLSSAVDALDGDSFHATVGALEVPLSPQSVRMLELKA